MSVLNAQLGAAQQDKAEIKKRLDKLEGYSQGGRANVQQVCWWVLGALHLKREALGAWVLYSFV